MPPPPGDVIHDVGAALCLLNMHAEEIKIGIDGQLRIVFRELATIEVSTHPRYESWQLATLDGGVWVGTPGGGVMVFPGRIESGGSPAAP